MSTASEAERRETERLEQQSSARGAGTNFLTLAGQTSLLLFQLLGTRLFGAAIWGAYAFGLSVLDVCARLGLAGSDKGVLIFVAARRATGDHEGEARALATGIRLSLVMGILLALGVFGISWRVAAYYGEPTFGQSLRYLAAAIPMVTLATVLLAGTIAYKTLRYNFLVKGVSEPGLRVALVAAMGLTTSGVAGLAAVHLVSLAATVAIAVWGFGRVFSLRQTLDSVRRAPFDGPMVRYAVPLSLAELVNSLLAQTNVFFLGKLRPVDDVGVYAACVVLANAVSFVRGAFDPVVGPVAAEAWARGDRQRLASNVKLMSRLVLLFALPMAGLFIVGGRALLALHGPDFVRGARTMAILTVGHLINGSWGLAGWVLMASGRSKTMLVNNLVAVAINVVLCVVLVPRFGMEGAAAASTLAVIAAHLMQSTEAWVIAGAHPLSAGYGRLAALGALIIGGQLALARVLGGGEVVRGIGLVVAGTIVYFVLAWRMTPPAERDMLRAMVRLKPKHTAKG